MLPVSGAGKSMSGTGERAGLAGPLLPTDASNDPLLRINNKYIHDNIPLQLQQGLEYAELAWYFKNHKMWQLKQYFESVFFRRGILEWKAPAKTKIDEL